MKEYYDILEIKQGSSKDEIKNAYRKLSKKYHPDLNPNNKQAEDKFDVTMSSLMEPVHTVKDSDSVSTILDQFVKRRQQIFIVEDEFGTTTGLISLEDAIETLLGVEIVDEHDSVVDMRKLASAKLEKRQQKERNKNPTK